MNSIEGVFDAHIFFCLLFFLPFPFICSLSLMDCYNFDFYGLSDDEVYHDDEGADGRANVEFEASFCAPQ